MTLSTCAGQPSTIAIQMSATETRLLMLRIPTSLKKKLSARVRKQRSNFNDVAVGILCDHAEIGFTPTGQRSKTKLGANTNVVLKVPAAFKEWIEEESQATGESQRNIAVRILSEECDVPFEPTSRWPERNVA